MRDSKLDGIKGTLRTLEGLIEVLILSAAYYYLWKFAYADQAFVDYRSTVLYLLFGVYMLLVTVVFSNFDGFKFGYLRMTEVFASQILALLMVNLITYFQLCLMANQMVSPLPMLLLMLVDALIALICIFIFSVLYHKIYPPKNMVMILGNDNAVDLKFKMDTRSDKYRITKLISVDEGFEAICKQLFNYDAVIINDVGAQIRNDLIKFCYHNQIRCYATPKMSDILVKGATDICLFDTPLLLIRSRGLNPTQRFFKRAMDIILCLIAMIIAAPVMLIIAAFIKLEDGGPVFYKQERVTIGGKVFKILKFRSMIVNAEKDGKSQPAVDNDPRITRIGRIIRATRVDELPQILNILRGDMSIVGPRPERVEHVEAFSREIPEFDFRLKVKGGLTGYAQVYGKYNTTPYDKLRLDLMYIENYSLLLDIKLILMTVRILFKKESTQGFNERDEMELKKAEVLDHIHKEMEVQLEDTVTGGR